MNAESWLEQVKKLDELIDAKIAERDQILARATDITAKPMDGMPFSDTGTVSRKVEDGAVKLVALAEELDRLIDQYVDYKQKVDDVLETLPDREYGVLHRYYIRYMTLEQIAEAMDYSTTHIWRIKENGLKILEDVIECNVQYQ